MSEMNLKEAVETHQALRQVAAEHQKEKSDVLRVSGFVEVIPARSGELPDDQEDKVEVEFLIGLYVPGTYTPKLKFRRADRTPSGPRQIARLITPDSRCPRWFKDAVKEESLNPTGMKFRVRVSNVSKTGKTAFVVPMARDLEHAKTEWAREKKAQKEIPKKIEQCDDKEKLAQFVVHRMEKELRYFCVRRWNVNGKMKFAVVAINRPMELIVMEGIENLWDFTDGIVKGATTLEEELDRNILFHSSKPWMVPAPEPEERAPRNLDVYGAMAKHKPFPGKMKKSETETV